MKTGEISSRSPEETLALARRFARALKGGEIVFLRGPIGAGKTVFVKGVAAALGLKSSPTSASFSLMKEYKNKRNRLFHIDLFRLCYKFLLDKESMILKQNHSHTHFEPATRQLSAEHQQRR